MTGELVNYKEKQAALQTDLNKWESYMTSNLCPAHVSAPRIIGAAVMATQNNPALLDCKEGTVLRTVIQCCQYGLEPDTPLQQCHILPYKKEAKLIVGYRGLIALAYNTGLVAGITAIPVYTNEDFEYRMTERGAVLNHTPMIEGDGGDFRAVYCMVKLVDPQADVIIQVMSLDQVNHIMMKSPSRDSNNSPWKQDFDQMAIKTVIKRALKYMPLSPEKAERLMAAVAHDNAIDVGKESIDEAAAQVIVEGGLDPAQKIEPVGTLDAYKNPPAEEVESWKSIDSRQELGKLVNANCERMGSLDLEFRASMDELGLWDQKMMSSALTRENLEIVMASSEMFLANNCEVSDG